MYELVIKDAIAAAHFLREYKGKCETLHGHTYHVEITINGTHLNSLGMVADFTELKKKLHDFLSTLDHVCLNELDFFKINNPTTENLARYIYEQFGKIIAPLSVGKVRVWESDTSSVIYYA
ncbi:MAG TPA: 6-carboxytetrahydropterin synthase QueD [Candidatus Omnitrophota bacterium]|nr:6-carboxytetrahydropterin synthase QueD [Candidatus Omnitrophota bacterium]HPN87986.1 6-carboxytetrahydropterin synthase QueD [Candidatus Omnitrophota bacterium]